MKCIRRLIAALIFVLVLAIVGFGLPSATRADYEKRVSSATSGVSELITALADDNGSGDSIQHISDIYGELFRLLPPNETVDFEGVSVEVDNRWFAESLLQSQKEASIEAKMQILDGIYSRLQALSFALTRDTNDRRFSKDEQKQRLAEILRRPEFQKPEKREPNLGERLINRIFKWLEQISPGFVPGATPNSIGPLPEFVRLIIIALLIIAGCYLVYRIVWALLPEKAANGETLSVNIILGEQIAEGRDAESLFREAEEVALAGDVRSAIRKSYVGLLLGLGNKRTITLAKYKTNRDYLRELKRAPAVFEPTQRVTNLFENVWYGRRDVAESDWQEFRDRCRAILGL